ncbi:hypothetical protein R50073_15190 [Maricurvus nonylphenolicus]|uniref:hypothetical protein n=1 Tax=Maricurvus nonylphenolicus TaxID=1008307 RepID=UPI0036F3DAFA
MLLIGGRLQAQETVLKESIVIACPVGKSDKLYQVVETLYQPVFEKLALQLELLEAPTSRAVSLLVNGSIDGMCGINPLLLTGEQLEHLIRIDVPVAISRLEVWSHTPADVEHIDSLLGRKDVRVGHMRSQTTVENYLKALGVKSAVALNNARQGLKMLAANRLDYVIIPHLYHRQEQSSLVDRFHRVGIIGETTIYPYLHKSHTDLAADLNRELELHLKTWKNPLVE